MVSVLGLDWEVWISLEHREDFPISPRHRETLALLIVFSVTSQSKDENHRHCWTEGRQRPDKFV